MSHHLQRLDVTVLEQLIQEGVLRQHGVHHLERLQQHLAVDAGQRVRLLLSPAHPSTTQPRKNRSACRW